MTARFRVGFLGGARHARQYADVLAGDHRVDLVGIADETAAPDWISAAGESLADALGIAWSSNLDAFLSPDALDLVLVGSEPSRHARLAIRALESGLHVCCDKPVAVDTAAADAVLGAAARAAGSLSVVNRTFAPGLRRLRGWVDHGAVGLPRHIDVEFLTSSAAMDRDVESEELVVDPSLSGGGELRNFLGYAVDAIRYLTGLEILEVYAEIGTLFDGPHARFGVEDSGVVSIQLQHGVTATATVSRVPAVPTLGTSQCSIRMIGSHGFAAADDETPRVQQFGPGGALTHPVGGGGGIVAVTAFFDDLISELSSGGRPDYTAGDARAGVAVVDAAYRSAGTGLSEPLPSRK